MTEVKWGAGNKAQDKAFDATNLHGKPIELFFGEHPHSRQDNDIYARDEYGHVYGFDGHRRLIDVKIVSENYLKESHYSGDEIRKSVTGYIFCDGEQVYEFFSRDPQYALLRAHSLIGELGGHPSAWLSKSERQKLVGRKIYFKQTPAVIASLITEQGAIIIETEDKRPFPAMPWDSDGFMVHEPSSTIKEDVLSASIWWFR